ncbi:M15 family metallopeptidase [Niabella insulamsoli]|uniref:M15 family metallopeptidase n=1 Tax=Niabella insulamsoli TaxID=3144874 RepID=UPI0031FD1AFD
MTFIKTSSLGFAFLLTGLSWLTAASAQQRTPLTRNFKAYRKIVAAHPDQKMVELKKVAPTLQYNLKYAGRDNFMHRSMYPRKTHYTFMRAPAATALKAVQKELKTKGLGLLIYDAYRPYAVTKKFWRLVKDERYVARPSKGSNHNRGTAVDLTLIELQTGKPLQMGTDFDNFTDTAHHRFTALPPKMKANRHLLKSVMDKHGFAALDTEWWHYTYRGLQSPNLLDISLRQLWRRQF